MDQICRSCMNNISFRSKKNMSSNTMEKFCFCMNMKISDDDKLPKQFCNRCTNKIESLYTFLREAQKVDLTLRNMIFRVESSIIVKPDCNKSNTEEVKPECELHTNIAENTLTNTTHVKSEVPPVQDERETSTYDDKVIKTETHYKNFEEHDNFYSDDDIDDQSIIAIADDLQKKKVRKVPAKKVNVCNICTRSFASKIWYKKHMAKEHSKKKFTCKICSKTFTNQSSWRRHLTVHSMERNFSCDQCERRYKRRKQLAIHMRNHEECKPFVCDLCSKSFRTRGSLFGHMQLHQNDKKHLCNVCGIGFVGKSSLVTHMRIHSGERPFRCGECPKAFNTSSSLRRHERTHRGEAPYVCDLCRRAFNCRASMIRHRMSHTGELPYKCPWCTRAFIDSWKRKVHLMRAHSTPFADIPRLDKSGERIDVGRPALLRLQQPGDQEHGEV